MYMIFNMEKFSQVLDNAWRQKLSHIKRKISCSGLLKICEESKKEKKEKRRKRKKKKALKLINKL